MAAGDRQWDGDGGVEFMQQPTHELWSWVRQNVVAVRHNEELMGERGVRALFDLGRVAMGMELLTLIRTLQGLDHDATLAGMGEEFVSMIETLLDAQGENFLARVNEYYDRVSRDRRTTFVAVSSDGGHDDLASAHGTPRGIQPRRPEPSS